MAHKAYSEKISGMRILWIDDSKDLSMFFKEYHPGIFDVAKNIDEATLLIGSTQYDAIILDYELGHPTYKGDCLIGYIKTNQRSAIIYANSAEYNDILLNHGADAEFNHREWFK